jgi:hypothetical protein
MLICGLRWDREVNEGYLRFTNAGAPGRGRSQRRPVAALRHSGELADPAAQVNCTRGGNCPGKTVVNIGAEDQA